MKPVPVLGRSEHSTVRPSGRKQSLVTGPGGGVGSTVGHSPVVAIVWPLERMHSFVMMPVLVLGSSEHCTVRPSGRKQSLVTGPLTGGGVTVGSVVGHSPVVAIVWPSGRIHSLVMTDVPVGGVTVTVGHSPVV